MKAPARASYLRRAFELGVQDAVPLEYRDVDLRERPDHPDHRFRLLIEPGAMVATIGDEDSGVGDLGRYALGFDRPPSGQALAFGQAIADLPYTDQLLYRRRLGYLPVGDGLLQNLTLRSNVSLPLAYASDHRTKVVADRTEELLQLFGIADVAELRPAQANEEDRRRAAVARAVALDPELVILEAPFDGLTARSARDLLERVRTRSDGTPRAVLVTAQHIMAAIQPRLTRVVQVMDGLAVEGAPA